MNCPFCKSTLLWSEDRGAHCDGCDNFDPESYIAERSQDAGRRPSDYTFESINEFVHDPDVTFDELKSTLLSMAAHFDGEPNAELRGAPDASPADQSQPRHSASC